MGSSSSWGYEEFGETDLGDARLTARLVEVAEAFRARPRGTITEVMAGSAEREAAYRFVGNERVDSGAIGRRTHLASASRCARLEDVVVSVDQTSLTITDRVHKKGFGRTGSNTRSVGRSSGLQVMSALAVDPDGGTPGLVGQEWHARLKKAPSSKQDRRPPEERESALWGRAMDQTESVLAERAASCRPWFQLDRGADSNTILAVAVSQHRRLTVRSAYNRALETGKHLHTWLRSRRIAGNMSIRLRATMKRGARHAELAVRFAPVNLRINNRKGRRTGELDMWCVHVVEPRRSSPRRSSKCKGKPIEWFLLTTVPITSFKDAVRAIRNYTLRWRIEEFHRAWKSGVCNIEDSQLHTADAFKRWATIAAAVAARAEHLKTLSRAEPEISALTEFSRDEIDAAIIVSRTRKHSPGDSLTLDQAVRLIADTGGYVGKSSGGPPGTRVIERGLEQVLVAAYVLKSTRSRKKR